MIYIPVGEIWTLIESFLSGFRTGWFLISIVGFKHGREINLAKQFLLRAIDNKDEAAAEEAIKWFSKVQLDEVVYYRCLAFNGMAVCNFILKHYVVAHEYCQQAINIEKPSLCSDKVASLQRFARQFKDYIESENLLLPKQEHKPLPPSYHSTDNLVTARAISAITPVVIATILNYQFRNIAKTMFEKKKL